MGYRIATLLVYPPVILELLIAGALQTQPKPTTEISNIQRTEISLIKPVEPPSFEKLEELPLLPLTPVRGSQNAPSGWYPAYQCTWYVWTKRPVGSWNNAISWPRQAAAEGWYVGSTPVVGAIGQQGNHVVYIEQVEGDRVYISERNYDMAGGYRERWAPITDFTYIY